MFWRVEYFFSLLACGIKRSKKYDCFFKKRVFVIQETSGEAREIKLAKPGSPKVRNRDIESREAED